MLSGVVDCCVCCWKWPAVPFPRYLLTRCVTQLLVGVWFS